MKSSRTPFCNVPTKDVSYDDSIMDFNADAPNGIAMEGYLYKRASNAFKTWSRWVLRVAPALSAELISPEVSGINEEDESGQL